MAATPPAKLYVVPTPVGNTGDITYRALEILRDVDFILAEDTRKTNYLLKQYQITNSLRPFHAYNEHQKLSKWIREIKEGKSAALTSDAGTPGISDPGFLIIRECIREDIPVESLPGPTAFIPALVASGLPCDRFCFEGFLPHKKGRTKRLKELSEEKRTMVLYESPYRLIKTLHQLNDYLGSSRRVCVTREITKIYEETVRGTLEEVLEHFKQTTKIKGEFVIITEGR